MAEGSHEYAFGFARKCACKLLFIFNNGICSKYFGNYIESKSVHFSWR